MRAIAKRLVGRMTTAAKTDRGTPGESEGLTLRIDNLEIAFHADGPVVIDRDFSRRHFFSR
jgi:hypothetical protein